MPLALAVHPSQTYPVFGGTAPFMGLAELAFVLFLTIKRQFFCDTQLDELVNDLGTLELVYIQKVVSFFRFLVRRTVCNSNHDTIILR